jgi:hypothetical protein
MKKSELKIGQDVFIKPYGTWMKGVVTKVGSIIEPFIQLDNGNEIFLFELEEDEIREA